ncbi:MAG: beta-propeller fold lactonase family protein [Verrucomicrobia bacterium]|nr:beta-propeller fold lactonase family protein [Verrucomicrobiota bacterium]
MSAFRFSVSPSQVFTAGVVSLGAAGAALFLGACQEVPATRTPPATALVGRQPDQTWVTPTHQILTPAGKQIDLPGIRPQALALSPDGRLLVVGSSANELLLIDPVAGVLREKIALPVDPKGTGSLGENSTNLAANKWDKLSLAGLAFSPDGSRLYFSNANGSLKVFAVEPDGKVRPLSPFKLPLANAHGRTAEIPAGLAVSADGRRLYVVANLTNRLLELDTADGAVLRTWEVGVAPLEVVLAAGKAYVSNQGGRRPTAGDTVGPAGRGTEVRVDARSIASEGSVSVIDLAANRVTGELLTGMHASALAAAPGGRHVVVANAGSDTLSVIDTRTDAIVEKIWTRQTPADLFGAQPCALAFDPAGRRLFVCNGTQNAVAVVAFDPADRESKLLGLIPVAWFPGSIAFDARRGQLCVANLKGVGTAREFKEGEAVKLRTRDFWGTLSLVPVPNAAALSAHTRTALANLRYPRVLESRLPARPGQPARPVPERVGEPSVFRHVVYIIKENRTYDQILGDMPEGNGDPSLCIFGEKVTPNSHALARQFVLLDNTYCSGVQSSDGHQWTDAGIVNDYLERQLISSYPRSYASAKGEEAADALNYASSGFLWDHVLKHGRTFRNYGEWLVTKAGWADPQRKDKPTWQDFWNDYRHGTKLTRLGCSPAIASLGPVSKLDGIGWDLNVPDVVRAKLFIEELRRFEENGGFPGLTLIFLPNDHTGGTRGRGPTPAAQVADNDLALGMIVEAISRSKFWPETCIFAIEDDPQSGWDHVSGYRTTCYVASPYTKRGARVSTQYSQLSVLRTMELMLGVPPMNQLDASAPPMTDCFTDRADLTPFTARPNQVPLDELNPKATSIVDPRQRAHALASERLPLSAPDQCEDGQLNEILWHAMKGHDTPFPRWAVKLTDED